MNGLLLKLLAYRILNLFKFVLAFFLSFAPNTPSSFPITSFHCSSVWQITFEQDKIWYIFKVYFGGLIPFIYVNLKPVYSQPGIFCLYFLPRHCCWMFSVLYHFMKGKEKDGSGREKRQKFNLDGKHKTPDTSLLMPIKIREV